MMIPFFILQVVVLELLGRQMGNVMMITILQDVNMMVGTVVDPMWKKDFV